MKNNLTKESKNNFTSLADVLTKQLNNLTGNRFSSSLSLQKQWNQIVGGTIAAHSHVLYLKRDVLHVAVDNSTWLGEMIFIKDQIKEKINQSSQEYQIKEIKFKIKPEGN